VFLMVTRVELVARILLPIAKLKTPPLFETVRFDDNPPPPILIVNCNSHPPNRSNCTLVSE